MMAALKNRILTVNCIVCSSEDPKDLYCAICTSDERSDDWQRHINDPRHSTTLLRFHLAFQSCNSTTVLCKICNEQFAWDAIKKHAKWHKIAPWYTPYNLSKKLFANHFFEWEKQFYCYPCDQIFSEWYAALIHISDEKHIRSMETETKYDENFSLVGTNLSYESLTQDGLAPDGVSLVICRICDSGKICLKNVRQHLDGKKHVNSKKKKIDILKERKNRKTCENRGSRSRLQTEESSKKQENVDISIDSRKTKVSSKKEFLDYSGVDNHLGGPIDASDNVTSKKHASSVNALDKREKKIEVSSTPFVSENSASCNYQIIRNMSCDYIAKIDDAFHRCEICDLVLSDLRTVEVHREGRRHAAALQKYGCLFIVRMNTDYYCKCCDCKVSGIENVYLHVRGRRHDEELNKNGRRNIVLKNDNYYCKCCQCEIFGRENVICHVNGARHAASSKVLANRAVQTNNNNPTKAPIVDQTELKVLKNSLTGQLSKLLNDTEVTKSRRTRKPRFKRMRQKNVPIVHTSCEVCNASVAGSAELHTHLAQHYSEGFDEIAKITNNHTLKNEEIQENDESNSESKENQSSSLLDDNGTNDCAELKLSASSSETLNARNSEDDNSSLPRHSSIVPDAAINNNSTKKKRSSKKVKKVKKGNIGKISTDDIDRIYDSGEKMKEIELSLQLSLIIDSENIYCVVCEKPVANTLQDYYEHSCTPKHREYLDDMKNDDALFENVPEQFSALHLAKQYMEEISDETVRCLICDEEEKNIEKALRKHMNGERHKTSREAMRSQAKRNFEEVARRIRYDWYNVKKYWCVPCSIKMESDVSFVKHLKSPQHAKIAEKIDDNENQLIYDGCACCALLWYGKRSVYVEHCEDPSHKWLKRDGHYLSPSLPKITIKLLETLEDYIDNRIAYFEGVSLQERENENTLISDLENAVKSKFSHAKVYSFGSRISGLGSTDSDIDVFLDCGNNYHGDKISKNQKLKIMNEVEKCLRDNPQSWNMEEVLPNCRTPLMKVHHLTTGLFCDISFENGLSVENTKLIKCFNDTYPLCRRMILFLKQWLKFCDLSGSQRITSYALYWCVIFYLQKETILPSIATLIAMKNISRTIAGWEVGVTHEFKCNVAESNFGITELLVRFFTFYAHFDYRYDVACPLVGDVVKKRTFAEVQNLPEEMVRYIAYAKNSADGEPFRVDSAMCIQDPFDLSHNITKAVDKVVVNRFRTFCSKSLDVLRSSGVS